MNLPIRQIVRLGIDAARLSRGGITPAEGRILAADALAVAAPIAQAHAPATVAPVVGAVLTWVAHVIESPPASVMEAVEGLLTVVEGLVPDAPILGSVDPIPATSTGAPRHRPEPIVHVDGVGDVMLTPERAPIPNESATG